MSFDDTISKNGRRGPKWRGLGLYFSLLLVQTAGAAILSANMVPLYRLMTHDFPNYRPDARPWWAVAGILLILAGYWLRVWLQPPLPCARNIVLGHIVSFVARISFVAVGAFFTLTFLNRFEQLKAMNYPPLRALGVVMMLFSLFCWVLELERLAKALQGSRHETDETHRD